MLLYFVSTHWGRVTHISVGKLNIIGSDNGLSPEQCQAIIWTNAGILLIGPLGTNFSEILIEIQTFSLTKIRLKMSSAKCCSFRLDLNVLSHDFYMGCNPTWLMQGSLHTINVYCFAHKNYITDDVRRPYITENHTNFYLGPSSVEAWVSTSPSVCSYDIR